MCGSCLAIWHVTVALPNGPELDVDESIAVRVGSGETLSEIAIRFGVTVDELQRWNRIEDPDLIQTGQTVVVYPDGYSPPESAWTEGAILFAVLAALFYLVRRKRRSYSVPAASPNYTSPPPPAQPLKSESVSNTSPTIIVPSVHRSRSPIQVPKAKATFAPAPKVNDGERLVRKELTRRYRDWMLLNDVLLPTVGGTAQIDHILVSPNCVFLIETKDMNGWVFGSPGEKQWMQSFAAGRRSRRVGIKSKQFPFYNPLLQNEGHSKALVNRDIFNLWQLRPIAVFVGDAELKTAHKFPPFDEHEKTASQNLTWRMRGVICMSLAELHRYIAFSIKSASNPNMTRQKMEAIITKIRTAAIPSTAESHAKHVEYARSMKGEAPQ